jgi:hypothetical protein
VKRREGRHAKIQINRRSNKSKINSLDLNLVSNVFRRNSACVLLFQPVLINTNCSCCLFSFDLQVHYLEYRITLCSSLIDARNSIIYLYLDVRCTVRYTIRYVLCYTICDPICYAICYTICSAICHRYTLWYPIWNATLV